MLAVRNEPKGRSFLFSGSDERPKPKALPPVVTSQHRPRVGPCIQLVTAHSSHRQNLLVLWEKLLQNCWYPTCFHFSGRLRGERGLRRRIGLNPF